MTVRADTRLSVYREPNFPAIASASDHGQIELVRQAFHESFAAAFTATLRLNLIWPIAIAILVAMTLRNKETKTGHI
jgi:hypothetical protein